MKWHDDDYTAEDKRDFYEVASTSPLEECQNCGRPCEELVYLESWKFRACPACAREAQLTDEAERSCPRLYEQIIQANGVREIEAVFKAHPGSCPDCALNRKSVQTAGKDGPSAESSTGAREVA